MILPRDVTVKCTAKIRFYQHGEKLNIVCIIQYSPVIIGVPSFSKIRGGSGCREGNGEKDVTS